MHLGPLITALVDGELAADVRERALAHAERCAACGAAVEAERRTKRRLADGDLPAPPSDLTRRLLELADPVDPVSSRGRRSSGPPPSGPWPFGSRQPRLRPPRLRPPGRPAGSGGRRRLLHQGRRAAVFGGAGAFSFGGVALTAAFLLGGAVPAAQQPQAPQPVVPPVDLLLAEHVGSEVQLRLANPAVGAVELPADGAGTGPARRELAARDEDAAAVPPLRSSAVLTTTGPFLPSAAVPAAPGR